MYYIIISCIPATAVKVTPTDKRRMVHVVTSSCGIFPALYRTVYTFKKKMLRLNV